MDAGSIATDQATINYVLSATGLTLSGDETSPTVPLSWTGTDHSIELWGSDRTVAGDNTTHDVASFRNDEDGGQVGTALVMGQEQSSNKFFAGLNIVASNSATTIA